MSGGLIGFWRQDLGDRLEAGASRTELYSPSGALWLTRWAWVCLIVALTLCLAGGYHAGFIQVNSAAAAYPDWVWEWLTVLGDERVSFALALLFALRYPRVFWALILSAVVAIAYSRGLKTLLDATRPPGVLAAEAFNLIGPGHRRASFPSGHSVTAAVFFGVLIYHTPRSGLRALFLLLAVLVGLSRVAVGVHWPVDVAAGLLGGAIAAWIGARLAAHWAGPATELSVHLAFVTLGSILAIALVYNDGGYHSAARPLAILGAAALVVVLTQYLLLPTRRYWRSRPTPEPRD
ncbi:MAG: phosphatase PAP2 family protein [Thiocapsa sp.]|jgi:membrane-associated phospholipid phosphatase|nr:phosphatase PAP2 family protein [Thiocapsa sp.]MCG6898301.1 phosphatase PAP2 family protein [Thiocapsa sp.]MCG6984873.1 phosphatase PAP2 family protein [Thiocapsa sp.]